ncbi:Methyltransferase domain [Musa troglodytarum]|uniref:tRNA N(3)-methylcytidine methyltransferase n=1 Tax=Musa troglodytarum TaxID=320322 RepID=A0A9E7HWD2_9LILI|nr:Methyltransferase domain [Musa troglodytarum]
MPLAPLLVHRHLCCRMRSLRRLGSGGGIGGNVRPHFSRSGSSHLNPNAKNQKYESNATKYWDDFYKRHQGKFFKDRHYLEKDWGRYFAPSGENGQASLDPKVVLEVGCGVGNTLFPLLAAFPNVFIHACDFSPRAVAFVMENGASVSDRLNAFICDVTKDDLSKIIMPSSVDVVTMIFMLSAVSPMNMPAVLQNVRTILKPSGFVLFRDYALGDFAQSTNLVPGFETQIKLANKGQTISENFYVRGDGTCSFYFSEDTLSSLFERNGFNTLDISVCCTQIVNRSRDVAMDRYGTAFIIKFSGEEQH